MTEIRNEERFAEIEYCLQHYFDGKISRTMERVQQDLTKRQTKELAEYQKSTRGILTTGAAMMGNNIFYSPTDVLKATGEWNSKTAEDYLQMCQEELQNRRTVQDDLVYLADEWRKTAVAEIGRERYDDLSKQMGGDLAFAYVDYRVQQMMLDRMVKQQVPKSTVEYIAKKGLKGSLLGLTTVLSESPLQHELDKRSEAAYHPSLAEKGASRAVSFGTDLLATGGVSSWGQLVGMGAVEAAFSGIEYVSDKRSKAKKPLTVEQCISKGMFQSSENVFDRFREREKKIVSYENSYVLGINRELWHKMQIIAEKPFAPEFLATSDTLSATDLKKMSQPEPLPERNPEVPLVVMPGYEATYLAEKEKEAKLRAASVETEPEEESKVKTEATEQLLSSLGLNGLGKVGANLGYVIAMLPDMLLGMFSGKTQSVGWQKDLLPIASILMGAFVKNPLLKITLMGLGGANLLNKVGHEAMERQEAKTQYKSYADEALNERIQNPVIQGRTLVATIDRVPYSIGLPEATVAAYEAGALPLNTLANAVLAKSDAMQLRAQSAYQQAETQQKVDRQLTLK
jgi:hypothetical protein